MIKMKGRLKRRVKEVVPRIRRKQKKMKDGNAKENFLVYLNTAVVSECGFHWISIIARSVRCPLALEP